MANSITRDLLTAAAEKRGLKVTLIGRRAYFVKIEDETTGKYELFRGSRPLKSAANGMAACIEKDLTMDYVRSLGYEVPPYRVLDENDENLPADFLNDNAVIVVKPNDAQQSAGVTMGVKDPETLKGAIAFAKLYGRTKKVMLQKQLAGNLYRVVILNGKLVAAARRDAAVVTGDGSSTISELIEKLNADPLRSDAPDAPLKKVKTADAASHLGVDKLSVVPDRGEQVTVSAIASVSAGGEASDVTKSVHPDWARALIKIADGIGLYICGFDIICADISSGLDTSYLPLLEMNSSPGFKLHSYPTAGGESINLAEIMLNEIFGIAKNA